MKICNKAKSTAFLSLLTSVILSAFLAGCSCTNPINESEADGSAASIYETAIQSESESDIPTGLPESIDDEPSDSSEKDPDTSTEEETTGSAVSESASANAEETSAEPTGLVVESTSGEDVIILDPESTAAATEGTASQESESSAESSASETEEEKWGPLL